MSMAKQILGDLLSFAQKFSFDLLKFCLKS